MNAVARPRHYAPSATIEHSRDGLMDVPPTRWPTDHRGNRTRVFLSKAFLVQEFREDDGVVRLTVCRVKTHPTRRGERVGMSYEGISWDDLQWIKQELGYGPRCAVEVFPPEGDIVNVANMRHLWVLPDVPSFVWREDAVTPVVL